MATAQTFRSQGKKIIAIGRNYADHAKELGNSIPKEPFFFLKPTTSYLDNNGIIEIPKGINCHFEVELGVIIAKKGKDIKESQVEDFIGGYCLGIDLTARNLQDQVRKKGLPWSSAKGFDTFCPISELIEKSKISNFNNVNLWLSINDELKQNGNTKDMIFKIPQLIQFVSSIMTIEPGDLLLTGTPSGVGQIKPGDLVKAGLNFNEKLITQLQCKVIERNGFYSFNEKEKL